MKCVLAQYLEALRRLGAKPGMFKRDVHVTFLPDEELGGHDGKSISVSFELSESATYLIVRWRMMKS
jgi:acetylornithine deacetylase/succinyl-diaminopimelate desuccinylase-like protein